MGSHTRGNLVRSRMGTVKGNNESVMKRYTVGTIMGLLYRVTWWDNQFTY